MSVMDQGPASTLNSPPAQLKPTKNDGLAVKNHSRVMRATSADPDSSSVSTGSLSNSLTISGSPKLGSSRLMRRAPTIDTSDIDREELGDYTRVNQYKVLDIIGHGSYGIVRKATDNNQGVFAMKILSKRKLVRKAGFAGRGRPGMKARPTPWDNIGREIAILKKLDHPNVVKLYEVLDDPHQDELILVFEYILQGPVMDTMPTEATFSEELSRDYFTDVILGLEYLHSQHVIHRDIKPQNLLLDDSGCLKIADFGVSEQIEQSESHISRWAGTPAFLAPETLNSSTTFRGQGVDLWAAGITLYCFLFGKVPWSPPSKPELFELIQNSEFIIPPEKKISSDCQDVLNRLLTKQPENRISIDELREHPWMLKTSRTVPSKPDNCTKEIIVTDEDIQKAIQKFYTPIHILGMIKQMAKRRSLRNPKSYSFSDASPRVSPTSSPMASPSHVFKNEDEQDGRPQDRKGSESHEKREIFAQSRTPTIRIDVEQ